MKNSICWHSVAVSDDGKFLVAGWNNSIGRVWLARNGYENPVELGFGEKFAAPWSCTFELATSADGGTILTGSLGYVDMTTGGKPAYWGGDYEAHVWDRSTGRERFRLKGLKDRPRWVSIAADGKLGAVASADAVILWDLTTGKKLRQFDRPDDHEFSSVSLSADGKMLSSCTTAAIHVWETKNFTELLSLRPKEWNPMSVALNSDGKLLIWGGIDGMVRLVTVKDGHTFAEMDMHTALSRIGLRSDGRYFAAASSENNGHESHCLVGDVLTRSWVSCSPPVGHGIHSVALCPNTTELVAGTDDDVLIWNWMPDEKR
jgi:WD40 repeat protein